MLRLPFPAWVAPGRARVSDMYSMAYGSGALARFRQGEISMLANVHDKGSNLRIDLPLSPMMVNNGEFLICDTDQYAGLSVIVTLTRDDLIYMLNKIDEEGRGDRKSADVDFSQHS